MSGNVTLARLEILIGKDPYLSKYSKVWLEYKNYLRSPTDADVDPKGELTADERKEAKEELLARLHEIELGEQNVSLEMAEAYLDRYKVNEDIYELRYGLNHLIKVKKKTVFESLTGIKEKDIQENPAKVLKAVLSSDEWAALNKKLKYEVQAAEERMRQYEISKHTMWNKPVPEEDDLRGRFWLVRLWRWLKALF